MRVIIPLIVWAVTLVMGSGLTATRGAGMPQAGKTAQAPADPPPPDRGEGLAPDVEKTLKWGEPANGLRSALVLRRAGASLKADAPEDLYLVVQNVSTAPLHFLDTTPTPKLREVLQKQDKRTQYSIVIKDPSGIDVILQPREVAYIPVFPASSKSSDGQPVGWIIAEGLLKDPRQTLVVHLRIPASTGAWTGDLRTGDTPGSALNAAPPR